MPFGSKKKEPNFKFELGDKAKDSITGFEGVIMYRCQWLHNCNTYGVKSQVLHDGEPIDVKTFDEPQLKLTEPKAVPASRKTGGPDRDVRSTSRM